MKSLIYFIVSNRSANDIESIVNIKTPFLSFNVSLVMVLLFIMMMCILLISIKSYVKDDNIKKELVEILTISSILLSIAMIIILWILFPLKMLMSTLNLFVLLSPVIIYIIGDRTK